MQSLQKIYYGPDIRGQYANNYYKMVNTSIGSIVVPINMTKATQAIGLLEDASLAVITASVLSDD